jgi:tetratricopeptide (TPR) repeat protein
MSWRWWPSAPVGSTRWSGCCAPSSRANPTTRTPYNALGYALADRGVRLAEAKALIEEALRRAPDDAYIIDSLGWVEYRLSNWPEARRLLTQAMQQRPDAEIAAHLGEVLWMLGERDEALAVWRQGLALDARNRTPDRDAAAPRRPTVSPALLSPRARWRGVVAAVAVAILAGCATPPPSSAV